MKESSQLDVYAELRLAIDDYSKLDITYIIMNFFATAIATYGLLANSPGVVVGAMIIAMLFGPISGISLSLVDGDKSLLTKASLTLLVGILVVLSSSFVFGLIFQKLPITDEILSRTAPSLLDLLIALAGGAAAAYAVLSPRFGISFLGVPVATAIVPPLSSCGVLLSHGEISLACGAFFLAFTNIVAIQISGSFIMWTMGLRKKTNEHLIIPNILTMSILLMLGITLSLNLIDLIRRNAFEGNIKTSLEQSISNYPGNYLAEFRISEEKSDIIVRAVIRGPNALTFKQVGKMEDELINIDGDKSVRLIVRYIPILVLTRDGQLFTKEDELQILKLPLK
jgi:uncharacterized hydrophobic protein (TIGR00271 family)